MTISEAVRFLERDEHGQALARSLFRGGLPDYYEELRDEQALADALYEGFKAVARRMGMTTDRCALDLRKKAVMPGGTWLGEYRTDDVASGAVSVPMIEVQRCTVNGVEVCVVTEQEWRASVGSDWRTARVGAVDEAPTRCVLMGEGTIRLDKFPDDSVTGLTAWLEGSCLPAPFDWARHKGTDLSAFGFPRAVHLAGVCIAAGLAAGLIGASEDAVARAALLVGEGSAASEVRSALRRVDEIALENSRQRSGRSFGRERRDYI